MSEELAEQAAGISALADPVRRHLYEYVSAQLEPVGREEAAAAVEVPLHTAKFHLDRLVLSGLLDVEYRRVSGRSGPGAARPAELYRRSSREWAVSLPARRYGLMAHILVEGVDEAAARGWHVNEGLHHAAAEEGRRAGDGVPQHARAANPRDLAALCAALAPFGFEPQMPGEDALLLVNCPFDGLARSHTDLVCGLNQTFVRGVADAIGCSQVETRLEPHDRFCCVRARPQTGE